jgi:hypothetical protein
VVTIAAVLTSDVFTVETLFLRSRYAPASVQRDFQWRAQHCRILLADLDRTFMVSSLADALRLTGPADASLTREPDSQRIDEDLASAAPEAAPERLDAYALGTIVTTPAVDGVVHVYDGLQRLTTLTILIAVLRDLTGDKTLAERLDRLVRTDTRAFRICLAGKDKTLATQIQPVGESIRIRRVELKTDMGRRLRQAAEVFREGLKPWPPERRDAFARFLLENVLIDLQQASDVRLARQMFVTGNLRGKRLDRIDLLKGQLTDIAADEATATRIVQHWNGARHVAGDRFEGLLTTIDLIERQKPQSEDCLNELADHVAATRGAQGIEAWLQRLTMFAGDDAELQRYLLEAPKDALSSDIWRLQLFRWTEWRPLALLWFADLRRAERTSARTLAQKRELTARRFSQLHRRCMAVTLASFSPADRETIFIRAVRQTITGENPLGPGGALSFRPLQIEKIAEALRTPITDREVRSTLLRWFESMAHGDVVPIHVREATVEHVLPQRLATGSEWRSLFPDQAERFLACNALGNLAALDRTRNERLKNKRFAEKAAVYQVAAKDFATLRDVDPTQPWTPQVIAQRTQRLAAAVEWALALPAFSARP